MIRAEDKNTIGIALVFVCMLAVVSSAHGESIRVGLSSVGAAMSTVWVAKEAGYFDKENLATELVYVAGGKAIPALLAGDITFSVSAGNSFLAAVMGGADIVMIAGLINKMPYQLYVRPSITGAGELKGKRIAIAAFGVSSDFAVRLALTDMGLQPDKDVLLIQMGGESSRVAALIANTVDGTVVSGPPFTTHLDKLGFSQIADLTRTTQEFQFTGVVAGRRTLEEKPKLVESFLRALVEATHFYKSNPTFVKKVLQKQLRLNDQVALQAGYQYYSQLFETTPYVSKKGLQFIMDQLQRTGAFKKPLPLDKITDDRFVKDLEQGGLFKRPYR